MAERLLHAEFRWAGGEHRFALPMKFFHGLKILPDHGVTDPQARLARLLRDEGTVDDIAGAIYGGLVGGGSLGVGASATADQMIKRYVLSRPLNESATLAKAILLVVNFGIDSRFDGVVLDPADIVGEATGDHLKSMEAAS